MMRSEHLNTMSLVSDAIKPAGSANDTPSMWTSSARNLPDGALRLSFPVGSNGLDAVGRFCLAYAGHCRAEKPAALRKLIRERLQQALAQHQKD